jgi:uncharacterized damage-inducible protein DinB
VNEALREAFRHHAWAMRRLLTFCRDLSPEQLGSTPAGTYGTALAVCSHLVRSDGSYLRRLTGADGPDWSFGAAEAEIDQLLVWAEEAAGGWQRLLDEPIDPERTIVVDQGANEVRAGIFVAQALHHGSAHREQVCAILTALGLEPPDLQAWGYAWETGRIWERRAET